MGTTKVFLGAHTYETISRYKQFLLRFEPRFKGRFHARSRGDFKSGDFTAICVSILLEFLFRLGGDFHWESIQNAALVDPQNRTCLTRSFGENENMEGDTVNTDTTKKVTKGKRRNGSPMSGKYS